jgi:hypothetical protein
VKVLRDAKEHFAPAVELGLHALVVVERRLVRAAELRQVAQDDLCKRAFEGRPISVATLVEKPTRLFK